MEAKVRKLFKLGKSVAMCIPKEFCDRTGLQAGDRIGIVYNDSALTVVSHRKPKEEKDDSA